MLIAVIIVLLARWRRRRKKRRRTQQQHRVCSDGVDDAFHPYVVDDAAADKLSCGAGQTLENGLCQVSCASNGSTSPTRHSTVAKRPQSYALSTLDSVMTGPRGNNVDNLMRTHNYGSNADQLENLGRPQHDNSSRSPEFVGRSPAIAARRSQQAPTSVSNGEASKGLNNLNKAENYRKKSKCFVWY